MKLTIRVADPAGNITILVKTPVKKEAYASLAGKLLTLIDGAEQVGFLTLPRHGGDVRLAMMGGEFCGNALRSAALFYGVEQGSCGETRVMTEISGVNKPLPVLIDVEKNTAVAAMPLPKRIVPIAFGGGEGDAVFFDGILHVVTDQAFAADSPAVSRKYLQEISAWYQAAAAGLMFYEAKTATLTPVVYVAATNTLFYENSCASGSAAVAAVLAQKGAAGSHLFRFREPGGVLEATAEKRDGEISSLCIGGKITLSHEKEVEI
ncbi:MAG TPA: hypothetical protein PKD52_11515 [Clostridiales bacterium]|nr:hypothetical protein [Clostridiales bacterium]